MLKSEIELMSELDEQGAELARIRAIKALPDMEKRWLNKACRLARTVRYWDKRNTIQYNPEAAIEAAFVLGCHRFIKSKYETLFLTPLSQETQEWVAKTVQEGDDVFHRSRLQEPSEQMVYNPIEIAKGLALALDNRLFKDIHPNIFVLAEINAYQQARGMWPQAVGNKVQYTLEKRLAKKLELVKYFANTANAAEYVQDKWLGDVVEHAVYSDADAIQIKTVCGAAYHAGIPLDQGFLQAIEFRANQCHNNQLANEVKQQATRHKNLHCQQKAGFWPNVQRLFLGDHVYD